MFYVGQKFCPRASLVNFMSVTRKGFLTVIKEFRCHVSIFIWSWKYKGHGESIGVNSSKKRPSSVECRKGELEYILKI